MRILLSALFVIIQAVTASGSTCAETLAPLPVQEIASGVFANGGAIALMSEENQGDIANIGFVVGDKGVAVIDTAAACRWANGCSRRSARTDKPILFVINTHEHPDRVFGNAAFAGLGATFVGHRNLPRALAVDGRKVAKISASINSEYMLPLMRIGWMPFLTRGRRTERSRRNRVKVAEYGAQRVGIVGFVAESHPRTCASSPKCATTLNGGATS